MSSRNLLLSDRARTTAPVLHEVMEQIADGLRAGTDFQALHTKAVARLERAGFTGVDYLDLRAQDDLSALAAPTRPARLFAAAWLAGVRLIDNIAIGS
jgi:pantoate--beta-alanine ligase